MESAAQLDELTAALKDNEQQLHYTRQQLQEAAAAAADSRGVAEQRQQNLEALAAAHKALQKVRHTYKDRREVMMTHK